MKNVGSLMLALLVSGCVSSSFNSYQLQPSAGSIPKEDFEKHELAEQALDKTRPKNIIGLCPEATFPSLPPIPELPLQEYRSIKPGDQKALDKLTMKHIGDVRSHAIELHRLIKEAEKDYVSKCALFKKEHGG